MKRNYIILFSILLWSATYSQEWTEKLVQKLEQKDELTFFDYQDAFYTWCEENDANDGYIEKDGVREKVPGWKQFKRWEWYWESRIDGKTGKFPETSAIEELHKNQKKFPNQKSNSGNWTALGPFSPDDYPGEGLGRINCVEFHTDPNIIYVGSPSGGLWKTIDGGDSWTVLTDENDVLGVSAIIVIPGNPYDIIYIGTGDRDGGSIYSLGGGQSNDNNGVGVLKSLDGGITWQSTGLSYSPSDKIIINCLKLDPTDVNIIYAGTTEGIYKTTNAGQTWELILASPVMDHNGFIDIEMHPTNHNILYASTDEYTTWFNSYIYKTIDGGQTWSVVNAIGSGWRTEIAVSIAQPDWVYAVVASNNGGLLSIQRSTDSGETFSEVFNGSELNLLGLNSYGTSNGGQGTYDLTLTVDPNNANLVYVGGINAWKSADGGSTWSNLNSHNPVIGEPRVHPDKHFMGFQNNTSVLFEGNDGGLDKTTDGGVNYESLSDGLVISQMYRLGVSQTEPDATICGFQDNGTKLRQPDNNWTNVYGGDGMECIIDYSDYNTKYFSIQRGYIYRRVGQYGMDDIWANGLPLPGPWVTSYVIDPNDNQVLYAGYNDIWKTTDQGDSWSSISNFGSGNINALAVAPSNSNFIYTSKYFFSDGFFKTSDGGSNWQNILNNLQLDIWSTITYISVKNDDPNTVWISVGSYDGDGVFQSTDAGETWTNISSGLPKIPIMCVIQNKQNTNAVELYAATDIGVYVKYGDNDWFPFYDGMPNVVVTELEIYYDSEPANSKIRASTYGRGLWESDLIDSSPPIIVQQPGNIQGCESDSLSLMVSASNALFYQWYFDGIAISGANDSIIYFNPAISSSTGSYYCEVSNIPGSVNSDAVSVVIGENPAPEISGDLSICDGEISTLDAGSGYSSYLWSTGENTQMINVSDGGNYLVSVTTVYGCEGNDEVFVSLTYIPDIPVISANGPVVFCDQETVTITIDSPQTGIIYHWSNGQTGSSIIVNETGDYSCYGQEGECEGASSNVISVTVNPTPENPIVSGDDTDLCEGETCTLSVNDPQTGVVYYWSNGETGNSIMVTEAGTYYCYGDSGDCQSENSNSVEVSVTDIPSSPSITANGPTTFCDIESVTLEVNTPQTGIIYHWSNGETGTSITVNETGDYSCYGIIGECEGENSNMIAVTAYMTPEVPDISADDPSLCEGEVCTITIGNVQTGVTYYWSNGETGTSIMVDEAGSYHCYGDAGECQSENSVSIDVTVDEMPETPTIIANGPTDLCEGESVELSVESPQPGVVYYWSTGQPGTSVTAYTEDDYYCYAQNGECISDNSNEISITINPVPETPMITASSTTLCEGEVSTLSVTNPESGVTYMWSYGETGNTVEITAADTYSCYGDNGDCQGENSNSIIVQVQAIPVPDFTSDEQGGAAPLSVQFEDLSTGEPVLWFWEFGDGSVSTVQNPSHIYESTGVYSVSLEVTTSFGCNDEIVKEDYIDVITGVATHLIDSNINLYPNPSKGDIYVEVSGYTGTIEASVINLFGVEVISETWKEINNGETHKFDLSQFESGTYYIVLQTDDQKVVKRFVIL